jgi:NO-binding membrane sensor protein with MHYT domain
MGGIGIWSMHFIGNRATYLGDGADSDQISYNVPFTIVSLFLPVLVLCAAFYAISFEERPAMTRLAVGGVLTGGAICGMHYIGQLGISNYVCSYAAGNIVGAAMIAVFSATSALTVFFRWKAAWADSWWRRLICAALLAGAVSGMHWTAAVGTTYRRVTGVKTGAQLSRTQTVIMCSALVSCHLTKRVSDINCRSHLRRVLFCPSVPSLPAAIGDARRLEPVNWYCHVWFLILLGV